MSENEEESSGLERWKVESIVGPLLGAIIGGLVMYYLDTTPSELQAEVRVYQLECEWEGVDCDALSKRTGTVKDEYRVWFAEVSNEGEKVSRNAELVVEGTVLARVGRENEWFSKNIRKNAVRLNRKIQQGEVVEVWGVAVAESHPANMRAYVRDDNGAGSVSVEGGTVAPSTIGDWSILIGAVGIILLGIGRVSYMAGKLAGLNEAEEKMGPLEPKIEDLKEKSQKLKMEMGEMKEEIRE